MKPIMKLCRSWISRVFYGVTFKIKIVDSSPCNTAAAILIIHPRLTHFLASQIEVNIHCYPTTPDLLMITCINHTIFQSLIEASKEFEAFFWECRPNIPKHFPGRANFPQFFHTCHWPHKYRLFAFNYKCPSAWWSHQKSFLRFSRTPRSRRTEAGEFWQVVCLRETTGRWSLVPHTFTVLNPPPRLSEIVVLDLQPLSGKKEKSAIVGLWNLCIL